MQEEIEKVQERLRDKLPEKRFLHTVGVRYTAESLAMRYDVDIDRAGMAGVLHDCAKYMPGKKMLEKCGKHHIKVSKVERENLQLLHAKLGAYFAEHKYGVTDPEILSAIRWHTTGKAEMSTLEQIIFLADYIEPHRRMIPGLTEVRRMAFVNLEDAVYMTLKNTVEYLESQSEGKNGKLFDPETQAAYRYYSERCEHGRIF